MKVSDDIRLDFVWDHENGRQIQIIAVNKDKKDPLFVVRNDVMGRQYVKLKLSQADIMTLIQELQKGITLHENNVRAFNKESQKKNLVVISNNNEEG